MSNTKLRLIEFSTGMLLHAEYRDAAAVTHARQSAVPSLRSTTTSTTTAITNHWAAIQYVSSRGMSIRSTLALITRTALVFRSLYHVNASFLSCFTLVREFGKACRTSVIAYSSLHCPGHPSVN